MLKTRIVKLSKSVSLKVTFKKDGKEVAVIDVIKDGGNFQRLWVGVIEIKKTQK